MSTASPRDIIARPEKVAGAIPAIALLAAFLRAIEARAG